MRRPRMPTSLSIAAVEPVPQKITTRVVAAANRLVDDTARVLAQPRRLQPGAARLRVRVRVAREHLVADEVLDER